MAQFCRYCDHMLCGGRTQFGFCEIKNRFVMPAMGSGHTKAGGVVDEEALAYYRERALGGFGLIVVEFSGVDTEGLCSVPQLRSYSDEFIPGLRTLSEAIHEAGAHGYSMGYNYNGKLKSAELLLKEDGSVQLIRRAETPKDYFATFDQFEFYKKLGF